MNLPLSRRISIFAVVATIAATLAIPNLAFAESETLSTDTTTTTAPAEDPPPETTTTTTAPAEDPPAEDPPAEDPPAEDPPAEEPPAEEPPAEEPPVELPPGGSFLDDNGIPEEGFIEAIAAIGVTKGCNPPGNTKFCPENTVTRGQMAAFLARALKLPATEVDFFNDDHDSVFENDINRLAAAGITKGCNPPANDNYCPNGKTSRGEMAAFLVRGFGLTGDVDPARFSDDDGSIFETDISRLEQAGITSGCGPESYCPTSPTLRRQMAVFLSRALGLKALDVPPGPGELGSFTTYYNACSDPCRVTNIHLIADKVDNTVVQPGEIFSVNDIVGIRKASDGYVPAGAIIGGVVVCCDNPTNIGGGTSQFATTIYNAGFFAGLEDIYHKPHSIWFSRYPMGREATLGFPGPDVKFRNDTDYPIIIDTSYTSTSVSVSILGISDVVDVDSIRTGSATTANGGTVTIKRIITFKDGSTKSHSWTNTYNPYKSGSTPPPPPPPPPSTPPPPPPPPPPPGPTPL